MSAHLLVETLRERDPGAPAAVYDTHAEGLYAYCWFQLRARDAAQVALRDTFIVAEAHISKLREPDRFGPWLYAIARLECARRMPAGCQAPDVPVTGHDQEDVDERITAWQTVLGMSPLSQELLELRVRHQLSVPDLATVFELSLRDAQTALDGAHSELEAAVTAGMLASSGPCGCPERALLLRERRGDLTQDVSKQLMEHAQECSACGVLRPRSVSAAKVYGLLPDAVPAPETRLRVMSCFLDPELVGYRLFVATRVTEFRSDGFPVQTAFGRPGRASRQGRRRRFVRARKASKEGEPAKLYAQASRAAAVLVVVALLSASGVASMYAVGAQREDKDKHAGSRPTARPGISQEPGSGRRPTARPHVSDTLGAVPSATVPLGARGSSASPPVLLDTSSMLVFSDQHSLRTMACWLPRLSSWTWQGDPTAPSNCGQRTGQ
ncbi:RNA polymerase sigma factor [Spirillospora sp. CA-108201]